MHGGARTGAGKRSKGAAGSEATRGETKGIQSDSKSRSVKRAAVVGQVGYYKLRGQLSASVSEVRVSKVCTYAI